MAKIRFGEMVRQARQNAGLSLREVAAQTGMGFTRLSRIEHGNRPAPGLTEIRALADLLCLDMVDLLVAAGTSREVMEHLLWAERLHLAAVDPSIQSYHPWTSPLLSKNTFCVTVRKRDRALCTVSLGEEELVVFSFAPEDDLVIKIPPEAVILYRRSPTPASSTAENVLPVRVKKIRRVGQVTNVVLAGNGFELNTLHTGRRIMRMNLKEGEAVFASVQATSIRTVPEKEEQR